MDVRCVFDRMHFTVPGRDGTDFVSDPASFDDSEEIVVHSMYDGVPDHVESVKILFNGEVEDEIEHRPSLTKVKMLLDNTPRNINITVRNLFPWLTVPLSGEYRDFFESVCNKAKSLSYELRHPFEIDMLVTCLATRQDGIKELSLNVGEFDAFSPLHLRQLFQSIATSTSSSLEKLDLEGIDLTNQSMGNELIDSLKGNRTSLKRFSVWDKSVHDDDIMLKRVFCAVVDHTQVEHVMFMSKTPNCLNDGQEQGGSFNEVTRGFLETLANAKNLRRLDIGRGALLPTTDGAYLESFVDAISRNKCLEILTILWGRGDESKVAWQARHNDKISHHLCMNRAAWGLDHDLQPASLWPHVLERAGKIKYYSEGDARGFPTSELPRGDVIYELLRERVAPCFNAGVTDGSTI